MTTNRMQSVMGSLGGAEVARSETVHETPTPLSRAAAAEGAQKRGKKMILGGFVVMIVGIVFYCVACFAGGISAELADILLQNAVPFGRITLAIIGVGVALWLVGSFSFLKGAMDADERGEASEPK